MVKARRKAITALALLAGLGIGPPALSADTPYPHGIDSQRRTAIVSSRLAVVRGALKDPASAKFTSVDIYRSEDASVISICGLVNSKNAYGGYAGNTGFILTSGGDLWFESSEPRGVFAAMLPVWCNVPVEKSKRARQ